MDKVPSYFGHEKMFDGAREMGLALTARLAMRDRRQPCNVTVFPMTLPRNLSGLYPPSFSDYSRHICLFPFHCPSGQPPEARIQLKFCMFAYLFILHQWL